MQVCGSGGGGGRRMVVRLRWVSSPQKWWKHTFRVTYRVVGGSLPASSCTWYVLMFACMHIVAVSLCM